MDNIFFSRRVMLKSSSYEKLLQKSFIGKVYGEAFI